MGYKPHEAYDLLHCELRVILAGYYARLKRERNAAALFVTLSELAHRHERLLEPWELLGEEDPDSSRRDRAKAEQEAAAHRILGIPAQSPEEVLAAMGLIGGKHAE